LTTINIAPGAPPVPRLPVGDVVERHRVVDVVGDLVTHVDDHQRKGERLVKKRLRVGLAFDEVAREVDVGAKLPREREGLDLAVEDGVAPVKDHGAELNGALGHASPVGALVVEPVGELDPPVSLERVKKAPEARRAAVCHGDSSCGPVMPRIRLLGTPS